MGDRRIGQHPLEARLAERGQVPGEHRQDGHGAEDRHERSAPRRRGDGS